MSPVRPLLSPLLVGRDELLTLAEQRIEDAAAGRGHLLLLAGEAGIGKSRLLGAVLRKAQAAGFRVSKGDLAPQDGQVPLASVLDLARTMRSDPDFGTLGEELLETPGAKGGDSLGSRRILVHEIADRLAGAVESPTLLAFEDLQWADEMSLEVIGELARRAARRPLLVVGTYRHDDFPAGSLHREWRARLLAQRLAEETRLDRLDREQTALVTTLILGTGLPAPRDVVDAVHRRTNGIPLHVEELLAALPHDARLDGRAIKEAVVPDTIEDAVLARVGRLSAEAQAAARAGAVIGRCFPPEVLGGVMDRSPAELDSPLGELVENGVLFPFGSPDHGMYDFRHQLLRDALYATVPPGELRRYHARAAEFGALIEGASEVHASIHFERAGLRRQAYRAALAGARAASAISSRREAFELYRRAVANAPDDLEPLELAQLHDAYLEAAFAIDNVDVAREAAQRARQLYLAAGDPVAAAEQLVNLAGTARRDVRPPSERRELLEQAEAELQAVPDSPARDAVLAWIREMETVLALDIVDLDRAADLSHECRRLAEKAGQADADLGLAFYLAIVDVLAGRVEPGLAEILRVAREGRDANLEGTGVTAFRMAAACAVRVMDYATAEVGVTEGLRYADAVEQSYCRHIMAATRAQLAWAAGRWDEAVRIAEIELVEPGSRRGAHGSHDSLGYVAFGRGDVDHARLHLAESLAVGRQSGELELMLPPLWGLAETALVAGQPAEAAERCEEALSLVEASDERSLLVPFVVTGVRASLDAHRPDAAEAWLARIRHRLAGWHRAGPAFDHADGLVRLAAGSTVSARTSLRQAIAGWDALGRTWEATWARLDLAACLIRGNRHGEALPLLAEAGATAERLGSEPLQARAQELAGIARRRGATEEPWRPLTAREFGVARLIAEGMTNAAIADELTLSPKTVSAHVEHILAKLGATRRAEVAAWVTTIAPVGPADDAPSAAAVAARERQAPAAVQPAART